MVPARRRSATSEAAPLGDAYVYTVSRCCMALPVAGPLEMRLMLCARGSVAISFQ